MKVKYSHFDLPFRYPFTISKGTKTHQPTFVTALEFAGITGYGEAPAITYYDISVDKMISDLTAKKMLVEKYAFTEPERYWHYLHHLFPKNPFLVCALDISAWDIFGQLHGKPLYRVFGGEWEKRPMTDYTIGIDSIEKMIAKMLEKPWPIYKIKLGTPQDIGIMEALRKHSNAVFRVDANAGWTVDEALSILPVLKDLGVELVEQPLAKDDFEGMRRVYEASPIPLFADESCVFEHDVKKCAGHFHGINIKLTKCSGITPAIRMIKEAKSLGLQTMIGCMNESTIGSAAIAHLSPLVDFLDMDGPLLLAEDLATGITYNSGTFDVTHLPGLGITVNEQRF